MADNTIQPPDPQEDDSLADELLETNPRFQALVAGSKAGPRKPFTIGNADRPAEPPYLPPQVR